MQHSRTHFQANPIPVAVLIKKKSQYPASDGVDAVA
jgi:hypothetical protein